MKIKPIKQRDASACAPTCIEMVLTYFDIPHTVKQIAAVTNYKKEGGLFNRQLVEALHKFDLKTKVVRNTTWEQLIELNTKDSVIIVSWMLDGYIGHVSVIEKVDKSHVYLAEPTTGKTIKIEKIKFLRLWWDWEAQDRDIWYPETKSDIQLRWMVVVSQ
ncbi:MAG: cysteine peptidase family C39 domain-containing protein [Candidatus Paceibacterota bacterium]